MEFTHYLEPKDKKRIVKMLTKCLARVLLKGSVISGQKKQWDGRGSHSPPSFWGCSGWSLEDKRKQ